MFKDLNIRLVIKPLIFILGVLSLLLSSDPTPRQDVFLFCLKGEIQPLAITKSKGQFFVDNNQLNNFFVEKGINDIEKWLPGSNEMDRDGDVYLNRIYRAYVSEQERSSILSIINDIQNLSSILYAEHEYLRKPLYTPNDPLAELQCTLASIRADKAWDFWDITNGDIPQGNHVLLASVDTGVDYTHPDLQDNSWINQGEIPSWMFEDGLDLNSDNYIDAAEVVAYLEQSFGDINLDGEVNLRDAVSDGSPFEDTIDDDGNGYADDLLGWDCSGYYGTDDNDPYPKEDVAPNGTWAHGTHVAGILAATTDNELGMASPSYNAKYISVKTSRENQTGEPGISDGYPGILYAAKAGMYAGSFAIINNSWGGGGYSGSENSTINVAQDTYGAVIVGSAGNGYDSGGEEYGAHYPSSYENCISVCAIGCSGQWGNWATYHPDVDLASPGESIYSTIIGAGYESWDGSSMAGPNAASAIGLLSAYHPDWNNLELRARIGESADRRIYDLNPEYETCNGYSGVDCLGKGMVDIYKAIGMDFSPNVTIESFVINPNGDDLVLNPGESATIDLSLQNEEGWVDAISLEAVLSTDNNYVSITAENASYGYLQDGDTSQGSYSFNLSEDIPLGDIAFNLLVSALGQDGYEYESLLSFEVEVSLFQEGFPYDTDSQYRSSPLVADLDGDGDNELVTADGFGAIRVYSDGSEIINDHFPFQIEGGLDPSGNIISGVWGAISSADIDLDGTLDFVVSTMSDLSNDIGHIYIFDINGLKVDFNAEKWLLGTPVIGNLDDDEELEIVVGGYGTPTSESSLYAINHDGSLVNGFPYVVGEKTKAGVALADMNGNGKDEIVFGTDSDFLYVLLDDLTIAPGFPIDLGRDIRCEPAILNLDGEFIILSGSRDDDLYAVNYSDATIRFVVPTGADIYTSPSFYEGSNGVNIFFGSDDDNVYGIDTDGNILDGFPVNIGDKVVGSIVFSDLNNDGEVELVAANQGGQIYAFSINGESLDNFPINYDFPFMSSPMVVDYDNDNDLEIICGSSGSMVMIDIKDLNGNDQFWSVYKGNNQRTGYYESSGSSWDCPVAEVGDLNCDDIFDILDIVTLINIIFNIGGTPSDYQLWAADMNSDTIIDILDVVLLVNAVLSQ